MKKILIIAWALFLILPANAEEDKLRIAVFDPTSSGTSIDDGTKIAIREIISSTIVNAGKHNIVERSLLEKIMQEQQFSNSGIVDDNQITEIGKLAGANKVVISVVTLTGGRNMLSIKMIDVTTASVERQKVKVVTSGELLDIIEPMTLELIDGGYTAKNVGNQPVPQPQIKAIPNLNPNEDEIILYLPAGYEPKKEKQADHIITVFWDGNLVASSTISEGFNIRIKNGNPGIHKLKFGAQKLGEITKFKIDTKSNNFFEFKIHKWSYLGASMYSVVLSAQKNVQKFPPKEE